MRKCALYYTCNAHREDIELACRRQLLTAADGCRIVSVSRKPVDFGEWNLVVEGPRSPETMHRQILAGLERIEADMVFLCESDVLYHPAHFELEPLHAERFYYNTNVWRLRWSDGHAVWTDGLQQVSGCCAARDLLLLFYRQRLEQIARDGFNRHYEPGPKTGSYRTINWQAAYPNLDIRHGKTLTRSKWSPAEFRNQKYAQGWRETDDVIEDWGRPADVLAGIREGR